MSEMATVRLDPAKTVRGRVHGAAAYGQAVLPRTLRRGPAVVRGRSGPARRLFRGPGLPPPLKAHKAYCE